MRYIHNTAQCEQVIVYVLVMLPEVTSIVSTSVDSVHVTVEPVKVVPFNFVTTVAPVSTVVYESESDAFVDVVV